MTARVIVLSDRVSPNGHCRVERGDTQAGEQEWLRDWDADIVATLSIEYGGAPARTSVRWVVDVDRLRRRYAVSVYREGWQHAMTLQAGYAPDETEAQAMRREGQLRLLNELLSASFGVPA
jgi:hypothetical protein